MAGDVLLEMLFEAEDEDRLVCSQRLRTAREAPRRVLRYLAQCAFDVAEPVLSDNDGLDASDLCQICRSGSLEHRVAIAKRRSVPPTVADMIIDFGEPASCRALLQNPAAELSEYGLDALVSLSQTVADIAGLALRRPEVTPAQAMTMFWWADAASRRLILTRFAADRLEIIDLCSDLFTKAADDKWADPLVRKTLQMIERRQRNRLAIAKSPYGSLEEAVSAAAAFGMTPETAQEIGYLSGLKPVTIAKILSDSGGEALAVLCKATGLGREYLTEFWTSLKRPMELSPGEPHPLFIQCEETYDVLSVAKAQTTLRYWNWALSSAFSPTKSAGTPEADDIFSAAKRASRLVFGS